MPAKIDIYFTDFASTGVELAPNLDHVTVRIGAKQTAVEIEVRPMIAP